MKPDESKALSDAWAQGRQTGRVMCLSAPFVRSALWPLTLVSLIFGLIGGCPSGPEYQDLPDLTGQVLTEPLDTLSGPTGDGDAATDNGANEVEPDAVGDEGLPPQDIGDKQGVVSEKTIAQPGDDLHAKLAEAESGSGWLLLEKGDFPLSQPLIITAPVTIEGAGREASRVYADENFTGDALIELVAGSPGNLRGVVLRGLGAICPSSSPEVKCGIFLARDGSTYGSDNHILDGLHVEGRFAYCIALVGAETCALRDCSTASSSEGGVSLYGSHADGPEIISSRLGHAPAGGTCTFNRVYGGSYGPGPSGECVRLDGGVGRWTFFGTFFGSSSPGATAVLHLHGMGTASETRIPEQITLLGVGNDCPRSRYGLLVTSERPDHDGAVYLYAASCFFLATEEPYYATGLLRHSTASGCLWYRGWTGIEVYFGP